MIRFSHCKFHFLSTGLIRMREEEKEIQVKLAFKVNERQFWITRHADDNYYWVDDERYISSPWKEFNASISDLLCPDRLDRFLRSKISQLGIPNQFANELRVGLLSYAKEKASRAVKIPLENLIISARVEQYTQYLLDESPMINLALRESENLNYQRGSGAVPATESAIASALALRTFKKKDMKNNNESCMICLEEFLEDIKVEQLPCLHIFHGKCIRDWLRQSNCCPICRLRLQDEDEA